jgi:hypothetical protein
MGPSYIFFRGWGGGQGGPTPLIFFYTSIDTIVLTSSRGGRGGDAGIWSCTKIEFWEYRAAGLGGDGERTDRT